MRNWIGRLMADKDGNPSEHVLFMMAGLFLLNAICFYLIYKGHQITLSDYGMAHGAVVAGGGTGQFLSKGS
jgi:hypothetical protein